MAILEGRHDWVELGHVWNDFVASLNGISPLTGLYRLLVTTRHPLRLTVALLILSDIMDNIKPTYCNEAQFV
ncbi:hypothetical protein Moror_16981 [Moniliophthora roreri MCA 2997]|uniref:Uncharacterized protein n=1 Tax=Moniliophthora roreri (strain MCA 2997) TaxID=1381753 RepID=V2WBL2_MONRO|nr:hypothetical protein Moror_16981 [Moniliophthora roreri MCA 2997]